MVEVFTLLNGLKVATYTMSSLRSVHVQLHVKGGSLVEQKEKNGIAHFMEHMLVQGIPSFPNAQKMSIYIESLAGKYNAYTSQLGVSFEITVPFLHTEDALKIASEVFFNPLFPEDSLEKERRAVINEIKQDMDSRWFKFQEFFKQNRFKKDSPLLRRTGGTLESVKDLSHEDLQDYWKHFFVPNNTYLFLIGNLESGDIRSKIEEYFGSFTSPQTFSGYPELNNEHFLERSVAIRSDNELQVNYIDLVFPSLSLQDNLLLRIQQNIALIILGRLRTSRLFQLLRYEKGLVYSITASDSQWPGLGYAFITSEVSIEHTDEVIELIVGEVDKFRKEGPTEKELDFTKNYLSNSWLMAFDNPGSIAEWISEDFLWKEKILLPEDYIEILKKITVKDLITVMNKNWDFSKLQLIIQGPLEDSNTNKEKYTKMIEQLQ